MDRVYLDDVSLKLTDTQIAEGQKCAAAFHPVSSVARLAIIDGHTFAAGETENVKAEGEVLSIKCLEISND